MQSSTRRDLLLGMAATGTTVLAGCLGDDESTDREGPIDVVEAAMIEAFNEQSVEKHDSAWHPDAENFVSMDEFKDSLEHGTFEVEEIELLDVDDDIAIVYLARKAHYDPPGEEIDAYSNVLEDEFELRLYENEWRIWTFTPVDER